MEEKNQKSVVNHFEAGSNCQVFNGSITGCVFAMPGSTVTQQPAASQPVTQPAAPQTQQAGEPLQEESEAEESEIPEVLTTCPAWQQLQDSGLVDAHGQPTVSRPEAALLADVLARRLGIDNKWKFFERLWHRNHMRGDYNTALNQRKSLRFQERLKNILG
jgi:hypothetical protein